MSFSDKLEQFEHDIDSPDFERHDRFNFEVKLDYEIDPSEEKKIIYMLEMYGFIPKSLHINEYTYPQEKFYNDLNLFTRYKTPKFTLKALLNPKISISPINRIISYLEHPTGMEAQMRIEIRLLGAIVRDNLLKHFNAYSRLMQIYNEFDEQHFLKDLSRIKELKDKLQELSKTFSLSEYSIEIKHAFSYITQFIFIQIEYRLSDFLQKFESQLSPNIVATSIELILETRKDRVSFHPLIKLNITEMGESFEYYKGLLKKYSQRILYLEQVRKWKENRWKQLLYSFAAGLAMILSVILTYFIIIQFQEYSLPFIIGIAIIYMLKDRLKYLIQWVSERTMRIYIPDRTHKIYDSYEKTYIGIMRESMRFMELTKIPKEILKIRDRERLEIENQEILETVFKYKKIMQLDPNAIMKIHRRVRNVHDIIRFNIRNLIQYADDPYKKYPIVSIENNEIKQVRQAKVYHFNLIFQITKLNSKHENTTFYKKVRIILTQNGIKRVEYPEIE